MPKRLRVLAVFLVVFSSWAVLAQLKDAKPRLPQSRDLNLGRQVAVSSGRSLLMMKAFVEAQIKAGNLRHLRDQTEEEGGFVHKRYDVYHQGVKVWGAQLIDHQRAGKTYFINGNYYDDIQISTTPALDEKTAFSRAFKDLGDSSFLPYGDPELLIIPLESGYVLAFQVSHVKPDALMRSFIDAKTGVVLFKYNDVKTESAIGLGKGVHGDYKKLSVEFNNNVYYLNDLMRPGVLITANMQNGEDIKQTYYNTDNDNYWTDPAAVDAHAYIGLIYDYYKLVHNRNGMDGANTQLVVNVHYGANYSNAFFQPSTKWLYFGDGDPNVQYPYPAALDIVCHEFTHGVTDSTSGLIYWYMSGALNEAFSDIMGVSCEFFHQPVGYGYMKAEWWEGEDIMKQFDAGRDLSDPSRMVWYPDYGWVYPDHMSKYFDFRPYGDYDNGGVHINQSIVTHWYYLLAQGGTNRTSGLSVSGIGVGEAEQIAYRGWTYYLTPSATFLTTRQATVQAANDIFGAGSTESGRVGQAWNAVGVY
jgi:bacillolysin